MYIRLPEHHAAECYLQQAAQAERHRALAIWAETLARIQRIKPRTAEERIAQGEALELLKQARP